MFDGLNFMEVMFRVWKSLFRKKRDRSKNAEYGSLLLPELKQLITKGIL
jgi:hypothetical protein